MQPAEDWAKQVDDFLKSDGEDDSEDDPWDEIAQLYSAEEARDEDFPTGAANLANKAIRTPMPSQGEKKKWLIKFCTRRTVKVS